MIENTGVLIGEGDLQADIEMRGIGWALLGMMATVLLIILVILVSALIHRASGQTGGNNFCSVNQAPPWQSPTTILANAKTRWNYTKVMLTTKAPLASAGSTAVTIRPFVYPNVNRASNPGNP